MLYEHSFHTGTINLNYVEGPNNGPPLVLLHGGSSRWQGLKGVISEFTDRWHVYAPDLRGHGKSEHAPNGYRMSDFADDIAAFLEYLQEPVALFGHSLGGQVGLMAAARVPSWVRSLIIGDSPLRHETLRSLFVEDRQKLEFWMTLCGKPLPEIVSRLTGMNSNETDEQSSGSAGEGYGKGLRWANEMAGHLHDHDPDFLRALLEASETMYADYQVERLLPDIPCPTLLIQGDPACGGLMSDDEVAMGLRLLPQGTVVRLEGIGHGLYYEEKEPVIQVMQNFLTGSLEDS